MQFLNIGIKGSICYIIRYVCAENQDIFVQSDSNLQDLTFRFWRLHWKSKKCIIAVDLILWEGAYYC